MPESKSSRESKSAKSKIGANPKVYVAHTGDAMRGKGLFARRDIKKDERLFVVRGKPVREVYDNRIDVGPRWLTIGKFRWLSPNRNCEWWYINHSCKANAGLRGRVTVVAMKNIRKGEEVTIDYSMTEDDPLWEMPCACGEKSCRKVIRGVRSLPEKLYKKYENYIPAYLKECRKTNGANVQSSPNP